MHVIVGRHGNQKIKITDPTVSGQHCQIYDSADGSYIVEDLGSRNGTKVDGRNIIKTKVKADTVLTLGRFSVKVCDLLGIQPPKQIPEFNISSLKPIWENYEQQKKAIQNEQRKLGLISKLSPIFTIGAGCFSALASMKWDREECAPIYALTVIGILLMIYSFYKSMKSNPQEETEEITDELSSKYLCPNPKCNRFLGVKKYRLLVQDGTCPFCHAKLVEK